MPFLFGCDLFYPKVYFHLINFSNDKPKTDITVKFAGAVIYSGPIDRSAVAPDIQYMFRKSTSKGKYNIVIEADSGRIKKSHPLDLGKDKWIIIGYSYTKPLDTVAQLEKFGFVDSGRLNGIPPRITVDLKDEPVKQYF